MSQTKAQLIAPVGVVTASGVVVTGVMTAASFDGDFVGTATSIVSGSNLNLGTCTAGAGFSAFSGDFTGTATGIQTGAAIKVGVFTATSFTGDFTGTATSMMRGTGFEAGVVNATGFVANVTGNVTGNAIGVAASVASGANIHIGVITATSYSGDASNMTGIAATNFNTQTVTANAAETIIDLSDGNMITMNQSANTTVGFASTSTAMDITLIRKKDDTTTARTITWPSSIKWTNNTVPTLINSSESSDFQQFQFLTRDAGLTWYGWENTKYSPPYIEMFTWGNNYNGNLGQNDLVKRSSPTQVGTDTTWGTYLSSANYSFHANKSDGTNWFWGNTGNNGGFIKNWSPSKVSVSSPAQVMESGSDWVLIRTTSATGAAINTNGELWTVGQNYYGQLGVNENGVPSAKSSPVQLPGTDWHDVAVGYQWMLARKTNGTLWAWGYNVKGQLGVNNTTAYSSPVQIGTQTTWGGTGANDRETYGMKCTSGSARVVKTDGTLWTWGFASGGGLGHNEPAGGGIYSSPKQVGGDNTWRQLDSDSYQDYMLARKSNGTLWGMGRNFHRQMSPLPNTEISSPTQIGTATNWSTNFDGGDGFCGAINTSGNLYMWGKNQDGELGQNESGNPSALPATVQIPGTWLTFRNAYSSAAATKPA